MANDTKKRILESALKMFSEKGYDGTNIRELSAELGLSKAAFYKHYESKEEIWQTVIDEMSKYYENNFGSPDKIPVIPKTTEEFKALAIRLFNFTVNDKNIIMVRKILLREQFRDETVKKIATEHFNKGLEAIFEKIFTEMIKYGSIKESNPGLLSFSFVSPVSSLVHLCDREPDKKAEATEKAKKFIDFFIETYGN